MVNNQAQNFGIEVIRGEDGHDCGKWGCRLVNDVVEGRGFMNSWAIHAASSRALTGLPKEGHRVAPHGTSSGTGIRKSAGDLMRRPGRAH